MPLLDMGKPMNSSCPRCPACASHDTAIHKDDGHTTVYYCAECYYMWEVKKT